MKTDYLTPTRPPLLPMDYVYITHRLRLPLAPLVFFVKNPHFPGQAPGSGVNHEKNRVREVMTCNYASSSAGDRHALTPQPTIASLCVLTCYSALEHATTIGVISKQ